MAVIERSRGAGTGRSTGEDYVLGRRRIMTTATEENKKANSQVEDDGLPPGPVSMDSFIAKKLGPVTEPPDYDIDDESDPEALKTYVEHTKSNWLDAVTKDPLTQKLIQLAAHLPPEKRAEYEKKFNIPAAATGGIITVDDMLNFDRDNDESTLI